MYTCRVVWPKGCAVRPEPHTRNLALAGRHLPLGMLFEAQEVIETGPGEAWAMIKAGEYVATRYGGAMRADAWETGSLVIPDNLWRVKHDFEQPPHFTARVNQPDWKNPRMRQAPEVYPLYLEARLNSTGGRVNLASWEGWFRYELFGGNRNKWNYFSSDHAGYFNGGGWPRMELLIAGGTIVHVLEINGQFARIATFEAEAGPPRLPEQGRLFWLWQRFAVVTASDMVLDPPPGMIVFPLVNSRGRGTWIPTARLARL